MTFEIEPSSTSAVDYDMVLSGDWSAQARQAIESQQVDGLVLNYARGFREQPIDFVRGLPLRRLDLLARSVDDLEPIYSLGETLEELRIDSDPRVPIELDRLPRLRTVAALWSQVRSSIAFAPQLETVVVSSYDEPDVDALSMLGSLTSLEMDDCPNLLSLNGIEAFPWISQLGVYVARRLQDIGALGSARPAALQVLELESCRQVANLDAVAGCQSLRTLNVSEGGEISSVAPLTELVRLERLYLYGSTRIADGDLTPIAALPKLKDLRMRDRRSYSPSVAEIQRQIEARG